MKKKINSLLLILSLIVFNSFSQMKPHLLQYKSSVCTSSYFLEDMNNRIIDQKFSNRVLDITLFTIANCDSTDFGHIEIKNDTLNLIFTQYPGSDVITTTEIAKDGSIVVFEIIEETECDCGYTLNYKIENIENRDYSITLKGKPIKKSEHKYKIKQPKPTFDIVKGDTINFVDIYKHAQGLHILYRKDGKLWGKINYVDGIKESGVIMRYNLLNFNQKFDIAEDYIENKKYTKRKYYNNGKLLRTCDTRGDFDEGTNCIIHVKE